jgi:hypothetical protein
MSTIETVFPEEEPNTLTLNDIPDFDRDIDWGMMSRVTQEKWKGIRHRTTEVGAKAEQAMYVDLLLEIINLATRLEDLEAFAAAAAADLAPSPAPVRESGGLELALMKALAGKTWDCEKSGDLMASVEAIMGEVA